MNRGVPLLAACLLIASSPALGDSEALFTFSDPEGDNVFDVFFSLEGDNTLGLATYAVGAENILDYGIDSQGMSFTPNQLSTLRAEDYAQVGFNSFLAGPIGGNVAYDSVGSQWNTAHPIFGIGMEPVSVPAAPGLPPGSGVDLSVPAFLGRFDLGTSLTLGDDDLYSLVRSRAVVFDQSGSSKSVFLPDVYMTFGSPSEKRRVYSSLGQPDPIDTPPPVEPPSLGPAPTPANPPSPLEDLGDSRAAFTFRRTSDGDTYEVYVEVPEQGSEGLAGFGIEVHGDGNHVHGGDTYLDPTTFTWQRGNLSHTDDSLRPVGFIDGPGAVTYQYEIRNSYSYSYSISESQGAGEFPLYGIGQTSVFSEAVPNSPIHQDINLGVPAFLGTLTMPGSEGIEAEGLLDLLRPNAFFFSEERKWEYRPMLRVIADEVTLVGLAVPESASAVLATMGLGGWWIGRQRVR